MSGSAAHAQSVPKLQFEKLTLPNGLQVILHEDHSTPASRTCSSI
jgi:predicted Zn-dependent peptidase